MKLPYVVKDYLGHGAFGSVFKVEYEGQEAAMKVQLDKDEVTIKRRTDKEVKILKKLQGIEGIAKFITRFDGIRGTYQGLGLNTCGEKIEDVCPPELLTKGNPIFGEAFLYEFINAEIDYKLSDIIFFGPTEKQKKYKLSAEFYSQLEKLISKIHQRRITIPLDISILVHEQKPYCVDWFFAADLDEICKNEKYVEKKIEEDWITIKNFKGIMERAQCCT